MLPLAEHAFVDQSKIVDYLLSITHPDGQQKLGSFSASGFIRINGSNSRTHCVP